MKGKLLGNTMKTQRSTDTSLDVELIGGQTLAVRSIVGGALMGLANLVPGISGGTMLLAVGVYPQFIGGVAEVSTLTFRPKVLFMLACVAGAAALAIVGFAQLIANALDQHRWAMYSVFIGLTLGGVPLLWGALRPIDHRATISAIVAVVAMALLAALDPERLSSDAESGLAAYLMLVIAGSSGGAAMILPGVSGAYLLLILGQYRVIVDAVALAGEGMGTGVWAMVAQALHVLVPVGVGVGVGVVAVSNLMRRLLANYRQATLGFLLGLLFGAIFGLWPFTTPTAPEVGDVVRGVEVTTSDMVKAIDPQYYRRVPFIPSVWQVGVGATLALTGFGVSWGISRAGT